MYDNFAAVYDILMDNADYKKRTEYLLKLFSKYDKKPTLLLDFACGTGEFSVRLAKKKIEVVGADISEEMLAVAHEKAAKNKSDILFLCQGGKDLELYGTVDGVISCFDSLNHIVSKTELQKTLNKISLFLEPERLFVFDVNTEYKHKNVLAENSFVLDKGNIVCTWQNHYHKFKNIVDISLDFFINENGKYIRKSESFKERAYSVKDWTAMLNKAGLEIIDVLGDMSFKNPTETEERIYFVTRKKS